MKSLHSIQIEAPVLCVKALDNGLLSAVDANTTIYFINPQTFEIAAGVKAAVDHPDCNPSTISVGHKGQICATTMSDQKRVGVFIVKKKKFLYTVERHHGDVESLLMDPKLRYLATGGQDGKLFIWDLKKGTLLDTLKPHSDFVSALAFHPEEPIIASGSFDRMIHIDSIASDQKTLDLRAHTSPVIALTFYRENFLLSAGKSGELCVWDRRYGNLLKRLTPMHDEVTAMTLLEGLGVLFVGTALGFVGVYDLDKQTQIADRYLKVQGRIHSMESVENRLFIGTSNGEIHRFSLFEDENELKQLINTQQYHAFYVRVAQNPLLTYSSWYALAEQQWEEAYAQAQKLLDRNDSARARALLLPFEDVKGKGKLIKMMLEQNEGYQQFKNHVEQGRYSLAYTMLVEYPDFKETKPYQQMERLWSQLFVKAQQLLDEKRGEDEAREILAPFRGISEKTPLIQQLFQESKRYHFFKDLIAKRDWKKVFELVKNYPFLKEFREYRVLLDQADNIFIKAHKAYAEGDDIQVRQLCEQLLDFPDYKADVQEMLDAINT